MFNWLRQFQRSVEMVAPAHMGSIGLWVLSRMALLLIGLGALFLFVAIQLLSNRFDAFDGQIEMKPCVSP